MQPAGLNYPFASHHLSVQSQLILYIFLKVLFILSFTARKLYISKISGVLRMLSRGPNKTNFLLLQLLIKIKNCKSNLDWIFTKTEAFLLTRDTFQFEMLTVHNINFQAERKSFAESREVIFAGTDLKLVIKRCFTAHNTTCP